MIIENNTYNEIEINKSKFITYLYQVKNKSEFLNYFSDLKNKYKDATHICYAYIIDNEIRFDDDKEPSGTAGLPIFNVLKQNNLNYVACFVIRYFGGIKLGSGGLVRAYSNSTALCLNKTSIIKLEKLYKIKLEISYTDNKLIEKLVLNNIKDVTYKDNITYILVINEYLKDKLDSYNLNYEIIDYNYFL